jgi:hypothetical protein
MKDWNPWKAWWLDVLKFTITFSLGAVFTVSVLNKIDEERSLRSFQWRKCWERDLQVSDEFREASLLYVQATKGAFTEISGGHKGELVKKWTGQAHSRFLLSLETVDDRFNSRAPEIAKLFYVINSKRAELYDEYRILVKQENKPGLYVWSKTLIDLISLRRQMAVNLENLIEVSPSADFSELTGGCN